MSKEELFQRHPRPWKLDGDVDTDYILDASGETVIHFGGGQPYDFFPGDFDRDTVNFMLDLVNNV